MTRQTEKRRNSTFFFKNIDFLILRENFCVAGKFPDWRNFSKIKRMSVFEAWFWTQVFRSVLKTVVPFSEALLTSSQCTLLYCNVLHLSESIAWFAVLGLHPPTDLRHLLPFQTFIIQVLQPVFLFWRISTHVMLCLHLITAALVQSCWQQFISRWLFPVFSRERLRLHQKPGTYPWSTDQSSKPIVWSQKTVQILGLI